MEIMHEFVKLYIDKEYVGRRGYNGFREYADYYHTLSDQLRDGMRNPYYNARWLIANLKRRDASAYNQWLGLDNQGPRLAMYMT